MPSFDFDVSAYESAPSRSFDPLPPGDYEAIITNSEMRPTKAGTGEYLALTLEIISGDHAGRRLWENLNVKNPSEKAENIARGQLNAIGRACGIAKLTDKESLHEVPMIVSLDIDRRDPTRNKVVGYSSSKGAKPVTRQDAAPSAAKRAWERG